MEIGLMHREQNGVIAVEDGIAECYAGVEQAYSGTISITCVYRCPKKNAVLTGSSIISKYLLGKAFDFDQLSSLENWRVAKSAYQCNFNYGIYLYYYLGSEKKSVSFSEVSDESKKPWEQYNFEHGHVGTESGS